MRQHVQQQSLAISVDYFEHSIENVKLIYLIRLKEEKNDFDLGHFDACDLDVIGLSIGPTRRPFCLGPVPVSRHSFIAD